MQLFRRLKKKKKKKNSWAENQGIGMISGWSCAFEDRSYAQW